MKHWRDDPRRERQPIFNDNTIKLGMFGSNGGGIALSKAPEASQVAWKPAIAAGIGGDGFGFEAIVPFARWKGYVESDPSHRTGIAFDCYTWAAAHAQATKWSAIFSTSHVPTMHPLVAAKQSATIDHISDGRFGLNVVAGWNRPEFEMFGTAMHDHDSRYDQADEWLEIVKRLWREGEAFDYEGKFYSLKKAVSLPHPLQRPQPPIMNAGQSIRAQHFAAKHADMLLVVLQSSDHAENCAQISSIKQFVRDNYDRDIQIWVGAYVVQRETEQEARDFLDYYTIEQGDDVAVDEFIKLQVMNTKSLPADVLNTIRTGLKAGLGGYPLVGTAEQIASRVQLAAKAGVDGLLLTWLDYEAGIQSFGSDVLPLLERAGLRMPLA